MALAKDPSVPTRSSQHLFVKNSSCITTLISSDRVTDLENEEEKR